jgi:hypothetical protein
MAWLFAKAMTAVIARSLGLQRRPTLDYPHLQPWVFWPDPSSGLDLPAPATALALEHCHFVHASRHHLKSPARGRIQTLAVTDACVLTKSVTIFKMSWEESFPQRFRIRQPTIDRRLIEDGPG